MRHKYQSLFDNPVILVIERYQVTGYKSFYPNAWADQRIQQELISVIAGWVDGVVRVDK